MSANRSDKDEKDSAKDRGIMPIWHLSSIGIEMGVAIFIGWLIGHYLDKWLGTDPWMTLVWVLFGVVAGFKSLITAAKKVRADMSSKSNGDPKPPGGV